MGAKNIFWAWKCKGSQEFLQLIPITTTNVNLLALVGQIFGDQSSVNHEYLNKMI